MMAASRARQYLCKSNFTKNGLFFTSCVSLTVIFAVVMFWILISKFSSPMQIIYIDTENRSYFSTGKHFLSITLDTIVIAINFKGFNMTDPKLIQMVKYLSPAYIRFGGNLSDKLRFIPEDICCDPKVVQFFMKYSNSLQWNYLVTPNFTMTSSQWLKLARFAEEVQLEPIFGLNALLRFDNGSWDYSNAYNLIQFSQKNNIWVHWELGNEPNSFEHKFDMVVNASQLGKDFVHLRKILNEFPLYRNSLLFGPDVTRPLTNHKESQKYLIKFLENGGNAVNAITWHQYYLNGKTAQVKDFLNPSTFNLLKDQINKVIKIVNSSSVAGSPIWLGETSSAYGNGAPNLSNAFVGSFLWIDKLGLAAKMGIATVMRQSIFNGYYALLDKNYNPNPDWWVSILYKTLVGSSVVPYYTATTSKVRLYVHCTKKSFLDGMLPSITIFGINLDIYTAKLRIEGIVPAESMENLMIYTYELTCDQIITSKGIRLNGDVLKMLPNNMLPIFMPKLQYIKAFVTMPPLSITFWVIPTSKVKACM